jgi:hypothetical protein
MSHFRSNWTRILHAFSAVRTKLQCGLIEASVVVLQSSETCECKNAIYDILALIIHAFLSDNAEQFTASLVCINGFSQIIAEMSR